MANLIGSKDPQTLIYATDPVAKIALAKAFNQCSAKYGASNCGMRRNGKAFCSGYDYGLFEK